VTCLDGHTPAARCGTSDWFCDDRAAARCWPGVGVDSGGVGDGCAALRRDFDPTDDPFGWTPFGDPHREIGTFTAPIDYDDPSKGDVRSRTSLGTWRLKPDERIGSLLVNPGGPGSADRSRAVRRVELRPAAARSLRHRCLGPAWYRAERAEDRLLPDYDHFFASSDITPDDDQESALIDLAEEFAADCIDKNRGIYQFVGTNDSARDMDGIRAALGEPKISYLGFSYGSELGATWATLFPDTVRAAVLDGAGRPDRRRDRQQRAATEGVRERADHVPVDVRRPTEVRLQQRR
jgi:pimeloyl-ACP methyl ester carboxylesterase